MTRTRTAWWTAALFVGVACAGAVAVALTACTPDRPDGAGDWPSSALRAADACATPNEGCPCENAGEVTRCGKVVRKSGDTVWCSQGNRQCVGETWGACVGDSITTTSIDEAASMRPLALGGSQACLDANPCDPYCRMFHDDGADLDAGPGLVATEAGVSLNGQLPPALATCTGVVVTPSAQDIVVTSLNPIATSPANVQYVASLSPAGCYTDAFQVSWDIDKFDRAVMSSAASTASLQILDPLAGTIELTAYVGNLGAPATANVTVNASELAAAPAGTTGSFGGLGVGPDNDLALLYPYDNTIYPVAIGAPRVMWSSAVAATAVKISLTYPKTGTPIFQWSTIIPESNPPGFQIPQYTWAALDEIARGNEVSLSVQRLIGASLKNPKTITVKFSPLGLRGQIFYTDYSSTADVRTFKPGNRYATNVSANPSGANSGCNNPCHTVSANGKRIATSNWYESWGVSKINPDGTTTAISASPNSATGYDSRGFAYAAVTPDGTYAVQTANWWGNTLDSAVGGDNGNHAAGTPLQVWRLSDVPGTAPVQVSTNSAWGLNSAAIMVPSFSPDGKKLLAIDGDRSLGASWRQGLHTWDFDQAAQHFSNPKSFTQTKTTNEYIRWPTFESDSRSVMFQTNPTNADDSTYGGMLPSGFHTISGKLYSVDSQTANTPVALDTLNAGLSASDSNQNYQPTMLPISVGGLRWAVFTTSRKYGNVLNDGDGTLTTQLWVSAIDDVTSATTDRSHPPFWLPGQTLGDNYGNRHVNERGYWVLDTCKDPGLTPANACSSNEECCGGLASPPTAVCRIDQPNGTPADVVWFEDAIPTGATLATTSESWSWLPQSPAPAFGTQAHRDDYASGVHQHYFTNATSGMTIAAGDELYAYVYLDPATPPTEVMLQWNSTAQGWNHRAYWGASAIGFGTNGTQSQRSEGALPVTGQWIRLEVPASDVGLQGLTVTGMAYTLNDGTATWDHAGKSTGGVDTTWVEDAIPAGATPTGTWNWVSNVPPVPFGLAAHRNSNVAGVHQHYFYSSTDTLAFVSGEKAFTYVWVDPSAPPTEIMLQFHDVSGSWEHRAYWGTNNAGWGWGTNGTNSRRYIGAMPPAGQWTRLEVPADVVGIAGTAIDGLAFTLNDGSAAWDHSGKVPVNTLSKHCAAVTPPVCVTVGGACLADSNCCGFPNNKCIAGQCAPPSLPLTFPAASFTRDYTTTCPRGTRLQWSFFDWKTTTPGDSKIAFLGQTGPDASHLSSQVFLGTAQGAPITNWTGADLNALFSSQMPAIAPGSLFRATVQFTATSDGLQSPTLNEWRAIYDCIDSE